MTEKHPVSSWAEFAALFHAETFGLEDEFVNLMMELDKKGFQISSVKIEEREEYGSVFQNKTLRKVPVVWISCPTKDPNYTLSFRLEYVGTNRFYLYLRSPQDKSISNAFVPAKHILKINWWGHLVFPQTEEVIPVLEAVRKDMADMHFYW